MVLSLQIQTSFLFSFFLFKKGIGKSRTCTVENAAAKAAIIALTVKVKQTPLPYWQLHVSPRFNQSSNGIAKSHIKGKKERKVQIS